MSAQTWDALWQGQQMQARWSVPDADVVALVGDLRREGVRRVLDLGFGVGRHVILLAASGFQTHGLEASPTGTLHCRRWAQAVGVTAGLATGDMHALPYRAGSFDFALAWNVVYHTRRPQMAAILQDLHRVLRVGGLLYLTLNSARNSYYGQGTEVEPGTFDNPQLGDGQHLHHYSDEADVADLLSGWRIERATEAEERLAGRVVPGSWHWMVLARKVRQDAAGAGGPQVEQETRHGRASRRC
ncbi:MAG: class I SAM-dependent methyltransferase [Candidatus Latescibacterota bacterium]